MMAYTDSAGFVRFSCLAIGIPNVAFEWTQSIDGIIVRTTDDLQDHLSADKSVLSFNYVSFTRTGTYTCTVRNGNGDVLEHSDSVTFNVNGLLHVYFTKITPFLAN